jgi:hypothetical protein
MTSALKWAWFGRRDRIPSARDPATALLDRAMVGQGLISAEELSELHAVGEQMDELVPYEESARARAHAAVDAAESERALRKQQQQAEAQARREARAAAVAGAPSYRYCLSRPAGLPRLSDRRSNVERLRERCLPLLDTPKSLADALEISIGQLRWLTYDSPAESDDALRAVQRSQALRRRARAFGAAAAAGTLPALGPCARSSTSCSPTTRRTAFAGGEIPCRTPGDMSSRRSCSTSTCRTSFPRSRLRGCARCFSGWVLPRGRDAAGAALL